MYHRETEFLFPMRVAPKLREMRGEIWRNLVDQACLSDDASTRRLAFNLLIIRLCNCLSCQTHSYRALHGCEQCARQAVRRYRGDDADLLQKFEDAFTDVNLHLISHRYQP